MRASYKSKGSLTVEAALVIPIFMFAILSIALFMKLVYVQEVMQKSITDAANGIAQYAYIYQRSGLKDPADKAVDSINKGAEMSKEQIEKTTQALDTLSQINSGVTSIAQGDYSYVTDINKKISDIKGAAVDVKQVGNEILSNPKGEAVSLICLAGKCLIEKGNQGITKLITTLMLSNSLKGNGMDADARLRSLNVVQSLWDLDFSKSSIFMDEEHKQVNIIVKYDVDVPMPFKFTPKFTIVQRASSRAWLGSEKK